MDDVAMSVLPRSFIDAKTGLGRCEARRCGLFQVQLLPTRFRGRRHPPVRWYALFGMPEGQSSEIMLSSDTKVMDDDTASLGTL